MRITRGELDGNNGRKREKGCQGTCVKDTWKRQRGVASRVGGGDGWRGGNGGGKMETTVLEQQ